MSASASVIIIILVVLILTTSTSIIWILIIVTLVLLLISLRPLILTSLGKAGLISQMILIVLTQGIDNVFGGG